MNRIRDKRPAKIQIKPDTTLCHPGQRPVIQSFNNVHELHELTRIKKGGKVERWKGTFVVRWCRGDVLMVDAAQNKPPRP